MPLLQRYLNIEDRKAAQDLHAYHVPVFREVPSPSFPGMQRLRELLAQKYPAAASLKESVIADASFVDELARCGGTLVREARRLCPDVIPVQAILQIRKGAAARPEDQ